MKILRKSLYAVLAVLAAAPIMASAQLTDPSSLDTGLPTATVSDIIYNGMKYLLMLVGVLGVIGFVIAGIMYLTAAGDEDQIERGKRTMINSIIGILVALIGVIVIQFIKSFLGGSSSGTSF